jgi:murein DD-endopeptidase MepM/ murein hydrolase activator NlpD
MTRFLFTLLFIVSSLSFAESIKDLERKIKRNEKKIAEAKEDKRNVDTSIKKIASKIREEERYYKKIEKVVNEANNELQVNKKRLESSRKKLLMLSDESSRLKEEKDQIEKEVVEFLIERYSMTIGIEHSKQESLSEIVDKEVYTMILANSKQEVLDLNIDYLKVNRAIRTNEDRTKDLVQYIAKQEDIQKKYEKLKEKQQVVLKSLNSKHKIYQGYLQNILNKQMQIKDLLGNLNILKKKEIKREKDRIARAKAEAKRKALAAKKKREAAERKKKALAAAKKKKTSKKQQTTSKIVRDDDVELTPETKQMKLVSREDLDNDIDIEVRKLGSSAKGVKISTYRGSKTIAPLKSYTITKKFGKYYDKVYKMQLFNESVSLKTKRKNAKVFNVLRGQVVYAKQNSGLLENVVIVKHRGNLHTIYSHLDKISPTLKVGKWIPKGYVVGRINDTLMFQATKNSRYINPVQLFK